MRNKFIEQVSRPESQKWLLLFFGCVYLLSLFININLLTLHFEEPRRALVALEMDISGNYIVPTLNGEVYLNKLPLFNWVILLVAKVFQSWDNWEIRLPSILSFVAVGGVIYYFVRKYINRETALLATAFWLTTMDIYFRFSILGEIDLFFTLIVVLQVFFTFHYYQKENYLLLFVFSYFFMALGVLTKGLPSIAVQGMTLVGFSIITRKFWLLFNWKHFVGIGVGGVILGSYLYSYAQYEDVVPLVVRQISESSDRVVTNSASWWHSVSHLFIFPTKLFNVILPWGIILLLFHKKDIRNHVSRNKLVQFSLLFVAVNIIPYWLSPGTRSRYLYFFIPFIMIVCSWLAVNFYQEYKTRKVIDGIFIGFLSLLVLVSLALPFLPSLAPPLENVNHLGWFSVIFTLLFALFLVSFIKIKSKRIFITIAALITMRIMFDFIVIPARWEEFKDKGLYTEVMDDVLQRSQGKEVKFVTEERIHSYDLPILGEGEFPETSWAFFGLSYQYSKIRHHIFEIEKELKQDTYYLGRTQFIQSNYPNVEILKEYHVSNWNEDYVLFVTNN